MSPSVTPKHFLGPTSFRAHWRSGGLARGLTALVLCSALAVPGTSQADDPPTQDAQQTTLTQQGTFQWPQLLGAQYTFVRQHQSELTSPYQGPRSLDPSGDTQSSHTIGLYLAWAVIDHLQLYLDTEKFMGAGVSGAQGLAGLTNGDVIRQGSADLPKRFYVARAFARYLIPLPIGGSHA